MRYAEIICEAQILEEGFLENITKAVANMATRPFQIVNNAASALGVIKDVISDSNRCQSICFLLRKQIIRHVQGFPNTIKTALWQVVPKGYAVADFLGMIIFLPAATFIASKIKGMVGDTFDDTVTNIVDKLTDLKTIATNVLSAGAQGIFGAFQALGLADDLLFKTLSDIHQKMKIPEPASET